MQARRSLNSSLMSLAHEISTEFCSGRNKSTEHTKTAGQIGMVHSNGSTQLSILGSYLQRSGCKGFQEAGLRQPAVRLELPCDRLRRARKGNHIVSALIGAPSLRSMCDRCAINVQARRLTIMNECRESTSKLNQGV